MKFFYLSIQFLLVSICLYSQEVPITFTYDSQEFKFLDEPVSINNGEVWSDSYSQAIDLGFTFTVAGNTYDRIEVRSGGIDFYESGSSRSRRLFALYRLLEDKGDSESLSPISYQYGYSSEYEENIFKIEWRNAGVKDFGFMTSSPGDFVNIQIWLHETSDIMCIHFGPHMLAEETYLNNLNEAGASGIKLLIDDDFIGPIGDGDMPESIIAECIPGVCYFNIETYPSEGLRYCFSPIGVINSTTEDQLSSNELDLLVHPNPTNSQVTIRIDDDTTIKRSHLKIIDSMGRLCYTLDDVVTVNPVTIDLRSLPTGFYFIVLQNDEVRVVETLVKL